MSGENPYKTIAKDPDAIKIDKSEYPPNKEDVPKVKAEIVTPKAKRINNIRSALIAADVSNMREWIIYEWLFPAAKNAVMDMLSRLLFNQSWQGSFQKSQGRSTMAGGTTYWRPNEHGQGARRDVSKDFLFETRAEADSVRESLIDWASRTDTATIADLCRISGLTPEPGDGDYGWTYTALRTTRTAAYGNSWYIELPRARML